MLTSPLSFPNFALPIHVYRCIAVIFVCSLTGESVTAADKTEEALRTRYMTTGSFVQMIPWVDDNMMPIKDIFTKLMLQNVGEQKLKSYEEIFVTEEGYPIQRIILNGTAGIGKSTLIDKMAYDWAIRSSSVLRKYKLVFVLKMHALEQTSELIDAIFNQLLDDDTPINKSDLKSYIHTNPEKVLILMDGFDEFMTPKDDLSKTSFGSILKILNRKIGRECCVVVTTRTSHFHTLVSKSLVEKPFTHVKVLGFNKEDIEQYVYRFYSKEHDTAKAEGLIQRIQCINVLCDLAKSPMLLLLMCVLWKDQCTIPKTMSLLYRDALKYIFKRKVDVPPAEIAKVVITIGKIALDGLLSAEQSLSFPESVFDESVLNTAKSAGVLISQRVLKGLDTNHSVHFIHKTINEYCAAMYFQSLFEADNVEFQKILDQIDMKSNPSDFEYLLRFCCGDNEACTNKILHIFQSKDMTHTSDLMKMALHCYFECQSKQLPSEDFINSVVLPELHIIHYNSDSLNSFTYLMKNITDKKGVENAYFAKVNELEIHFCDLNKFSEGLAHTISGMTNMSILTLTTCSLTDSNMEHIASSLSNTVNLTKLNLSGNRDLGGSVQLWWPDLVCLKHLKELDLCGCLLTCEDVKHILSSEMNDLVILNLTWNYALGSCAQLWAPHLQQLKHLQKLHLDCCSLTGEDVEPIADRLSKNPNLVELDLYGNNKLGNLAASWAPHLQQLKHLQKMQLGGCSLTAEDVKPIAVSLSMIPNLEELDLSRNENLGNSAKSWAPHLQQLEHLQKLDLTRCSLTDEDMKLVAESLSMIPNLAVLRLLGNQNLRNSAASWAPHLQQLKHIQKLDLRACSLTGEDVKQLTKSLSHINISYY